MKNLNKVHIYHSILFSLIILLFLEMTASCGMVAKKTPMQTAGDMAYCWAPDGKVAFYRLIDYWIKMEPDPVPGGGGVYDDYEKDDEAFIAVRDPKILNIKEYMDWSKANGKILLYPWTWNNTKEAKVLFKVPFKGMAAPIKYMDWSKERDEILLSTGLLVAIKPDGSNLRKIVDKEGGYCSHATWSPDGKKILYAFLPPSLMDERIAQMVAKGLKPGLYIVNADGSSDKFLIEGENGSWSPDGKQIAYQGMKELIIYSINVDGTGKKLLLERGANPIWSPDGKWILCGAKLIIPDGKFVANIRREVPGSFSRWSPDMKYLLSIEGGLNEFKIPEEEGRKQ